MNYEELIVLYHNIFLYAGIAALFFLLLSVFLFFWLKIPKVIGEMTGSTARKEIERLKEASASTGKLPKDYTHGTKRQRPGQVVTPSGRIKTVGAVTGETREREELPAAGIDAPATDLLAERAEAPATDVLSEKKETADVSGVKEEISGKESSEDKAGQEMTEAPILEGFCITKTICMVHTEDVI